MDPEMNLEYLQETEQYPLEDRQMLDWLISCRNNNAFKWLMKKLHDRRDECEALVRNVPSDLGQLVAREQALGCVEGLTYLDAVMDEHIKTLTEKVRNG